MDTSDSPHLKKYTDVKKATSFERILKSNAPRTKYRDIKFNRDHIHQGQRKLLISEIEFLTLTRHKHMRKKNAILLYIGSASGEHIAILVKMFPHMEYHLYDKRDHHPVLFDLPNVHIHSEYFDNEKAKEYKGRNVLMISDIRNLDIGSVKHNTKKMDAIVDEDIVMQWEWYKIMNPMSALLKFRLPWQAGKTRYLSGDIYFQCWQGIYSAETRLIPDGKTKEYDNKTFEEQLFHFNMVTRRQWYPHDYRGYGHCYDCRTEIEILSEYLKHIKGNKDKEAVYELGKSISKLLDKRIVDSEL